MWISAPAVLSAGDGENDEITVITTLEGGITPGG
jgi:hypothetical protein